MSISDLITEEIARQGLSQFKVAVGLENRTNGSTFEQEQVFLPGDGDGVYGRLPGFTKPSSWGTKPPMQVGPGDEKVFGTFASGTDSNAGSVRYRRQGEPGMPPLFVTFAWYAGATESKSTKAARLGAAILSSERQDLKSMWRGQLKTDGGFVIMKGSSLAPGPGWMRSGDHPDVRRLHDITVTFQEYGTPAENKLEFTIS